MIKFIVLQVVLYVKDTLETYKLCETYIQEVATATLL